ncbi:MAG: prepilin-type N-terminal cleavage/methylation domain-containing protein [Planctomycetaceae bacterium]
MRPVSPFLCRIPARRAVRGNRRGFTMVELLVVIGILLLVAAVTVSAVNMTLSGDRIRGAARQVQSYLEGARGRASYGGTTKGKGYQCGVRFIRDANNSSLITSMQYVELDPANPPISGIGSTYAFWRSGTDITRLVSANSAVTQWNVRAQQGLLYNGQIIIIKGRRYQLDTSYVTSMPEELRLLTAVPDSDVDGLPGYSTTADAEAVPAASNNLDYKILLPAQPMANQEPRVLGTGVVLDTTLSKGLGYFTSNSLPIDIMFSPRGTVVGPLAATGVVEFVVGDLEDSLKGAPIRLGPLAASRYLYARQHCHGDEWRHVVLLSLTRELRT